MWLIYLHMLCPTIVGGEYFKGLVVKGIKIKQRDATSILKATVAAFDHV